MGKSKSRKKTGAFIGQFVLLLVGAFFGGVISFYGTSLLKENVPDGGIYRVGLLLIFLAMLFIGLYLQIIIHEAGHLIFGLLTRYKFSSFRIGSIIWLHDNGKIRLKKIKVSGTGGQCLLSPPEMKEGKYPFILYNFGGVFLNLIMSGIFFILFLFIENPYFKTFAISFILLGLVLAVSNGVPLRMGLVDNDGRNTLSISKNKSAQKAFWCQLKMNELLSKNVHPTDMPDELFYLPSDEEMQNPICASAAVLYCNRLMCEKRFDEAEVIMEKLVNEDNGMTDLHRNLLKCDIIFCKLISGDESKIAEIENILDKEQKNFMSSMANYPTVIRTQYALDKHNKKDVAASIVMQKFEKVAKKYPYQKDIEIERELMFLI